MSLFAFFHNNEKEELISAVHKRKKKLLKCTKHLFAAEMRMSKLRTVETHLLQTVEQLNPSEKAAVDVVLNEDRTEEQIIDYLSKIEKEVLSLIESGNTEAIKTRLKKYIYVIEQLAQRIEGLEMNKKAQLARIRDEEEKLARNAQNLAFKSTIQEREQKKKALELLKQGIKIESKENSIARKKFYRSITELGTNAAALLKELFKISSQVATVGTNVGRMGVAGSAALAKKVEAALK